MLSVHNMRFICMWCSLVVVVATARAQDGYYAPQTFKQVGREMFLPIDTPWSASRRSSSDAVDSYQRAIFTPAEDVVPQGSSQGSQWKAQPYDEYGREPPSGQEEWRAPYGTSKERQATILHHKQSLSSEGAFRYEYASDTGLEAGEVISPDGSRVGAYQYKDPAGKLVKLKYRAGKEGFQILEGSHVPKSPEPSSPQAQTGNYYPEQYQQQPYQQQPYQQQPYQQQPEQQSPDWRQVPSVPQPPPTPPQYYNPTWKTDGRNEGQYNAVEDQNRGPHSFGTGYAFSFKG